VNGRFIAKPFLSERSLLSRGDSWRAVLSRLRYLDQYLLHDVSPRSLAAVTRGLGSRRTRQVLRVERSIVSSDRDYYRHTTAGLPRIESLTGLRWFAVLAVFFSHNVPGGNTRSWVSSLFGSGYMGVTVFFVLSGFILTVTYGDSLSEPTWSRVGNYAVARFARIYPVYLFVLLYVVFSTASSSSLPSGWWQHFFAIQAWNSDVNFAYALNGPGWSIGVETFMYAMFPLLILIFRPLLRTPARGLLLACGAVIFIAAAWFYFRQTGRAGLPVEDPASAHRWLYRMPAMRLGDFVLGIGASAAFLGLRGRAGVHKWAPWVATLSSILIIALMATPKLFRSAISWDLLYAVPAAVLIFALALTPDRGLARFLGTRPLVALGEMSYAFFLVHVPIGGLMFGGVLAAGFTPLSVATLVMGLLMTICLSWGIHLLVERPARIWIRRHAFSRHAPAL